MLDLASVTSAVLVELGEVHSRTPSNRPLSFPIVGALSRSADQIRGDLLCLGGVVSSRSYGVPSPSFRAGGGMATLVKTRE